MTNDELDAIKGRHGMIFVTDEKLPPMTKRIGDDMLALIVEVERLTQELEAYKYVVSAVHVHIKNAAACFKPSPL